MFLIDSHGTVCREVVLERLEFQAEPVRDIPDNEGPEVGKTGKRAHAIPLVGRDLDLAFPARIFEWECLKKTRLDLFRARKRKLPSFRLDHAFLPAERRVTPPGHNGMMVC